ncbi:MAG: hypothetical protein C5B49_06545 [Bdellovibrio sp.]|nr:MAG: hypothetical protein C5B49_06545 [Bdellovibrio sp.]
MENTAKQQHNHGPGRSSNLYQIGKWGAIAIIGFFLITEHTAHVIQVLPYLLLLACPLMHIFMHHGHGGHHHHHHADEKETK